MPVFLTTYSSIFFFFFVYSTLSSISANNNATDFTWSTGSPLSCKTFLTYRARPPYSDLVTISDLFGITRLTISAVNNLASEDALLAPDKILIIPIGCTSNGTRYFSNVTHQIKKGDTFYSVSTRAFQNLTEYHLVQDMNPGMNPNNLTIGDNAVFPLLCKCPGKLGLGTDQYLITYVWQPGDEVLPVSSMFQTASSDVVRANDNRNFTAATYFPVLIPVKLVPILLQRFPSDKLKSRHDQHLLTAVLSSTMAFLIVFSALMAVFYKKTKANLQTCFTPTDRVLKGGDIESKKIQSNLLPGLSGYLGKPIVYDPSVIMKATMNLNEGCRIGRSVYKAVIDDCTFAVKKTRDATEEVGILQKLNHANLVNLIGVSSDKEGNFYIVHDFAENGSLDTWLHPKAPSSTRCLTWRQRLLIAIDVANGLQYLHEHTEPSIVHEDIRTGNILLGQNFKAKIGNFGCARRVSCPAMVNIDVFSFGVVLLELLTGKKDMEAKEKMVVWKEMEVEVKGGFDDEERRKEVLRKWMDPWLENAYPIEDALSLAMVARSCMSEKGLERPKMGEVVLGLSIVAQASPTCNWDSRFESVEVIPVSNEIVAR